MALSLLEQAKQHILRGFDDQSCRGVSLVATTATVDRVSLAAWTIDECAGDPTGEDLEPDDFRSLYVVNQLSGARAVRHAALKLRGVGGRRHLSDRVFAHDATTLPQLRQANYAALSTVVGLAGAFKPESLELLILDERRAGEMAQLLPMIRRARPLFTLVLVGQEPGDDWPWRHLGEPLVLREPAQTPPTLRPVFREPEQAI